ncbi:Protein PAT1 -like protein 1 [Toxocara canis]|uniref:Protein PAT1-like protein 1 n=1 Tax=Toxocara canis TaxID=6265 RepID=A0A0B2VEW0_TOXCA|nr:Protein PAT1 -like protein 1 [Toxocara canis]
MSRIGLNGMCGRPLTDEDDFQFGILPDDESEVSGEGEEIDAVNEETFGADVGSLVIDDLEQYSKQTEGLRLEDGLTAWTDEPSCSVSAPDPSQLPIPPFTTHYGNSSYRLASSLNEGVTEGLRLEDGLTAWTDEPSCSVSAPDPSQLPIPPFTTHYGNSSYRLASSLNEGSELSASYQLNLGTVDSLWKNGVKDESQSVWAAPPELTSAITRSAFDFINKADSPANSRVQPNYDHHTDKLAQTVEAPKPRALAAIPKGALTLEEIEKNHISLARRSSLPPQPPPIPSEGAMTVTDFERRLLMETAGASGMARAESGERNLPPPPPQALRPQQQQPMPPIPIMPFPFMPPFVAQTLREGAMTVTDFERRLLMETAGASGMARAESGERNLPPPPPQALRPQQQQPMPPIPIMPFPFMPPFVAQTLREGAMTVTDFERRLLMETAGASGMARAESGERNLPPPPPQALRPQQQQPMPPIPIMPFPFMPPFVAQTLRAHLTGQLPELPPGFPPVPPQMRAAFMAALAQNVTQGPPPGALFGQPPPLIAPPFRPVQRPPILRPSHIHPQLPPHLHYQSAQQLGRVPSIYYRDPQSKRAGLPSGKTISDFAFDPYAGFMSRKEREWLVKIQSLQCQGCGNPYEDDFYYTVWKQRKLAEERRAHGLRPQNTECDFSATVVNAHHYVPPTFEGSLGRPTLPTANFPRLLIDVHSDSVDEEERSNVRSSTQKKLRALLMQLEGVAVLLIECEDRRRQLKASTLPEEIHAQLSNEMRTRVEAAVEFLSSNLRTALLVSKGRHMFARTLSLASKTQQVTLIESLFAVLPLLLKKVDANELNTSLTSALYESMSRLSKDNLSSLLRSLPVDEISKTPICCNNAFLVNFLLSMLLCCARKKYPIGSEPSPLCSWLSSAEGMCPLDEQWSPSMFLPALTIHTEDLRLLQTWLENNFVSRVNIFRASVASYVAIYLAFRWNQKKKAIAQRAEKIREKQNVVNDALARAHLI